MTTLAALAGHTSAIRLGLLVTGVTYRHPSVFAAQALTVDHASHGRFDMGLGAAWYGTEHEQLGIEFPSRPERFDLLEDTIEIVNRLFTGERVSYHGRRYSLADAQLRPAPIQRPRPPLWIGGSGRKRTLPLVAKYADVWHTHGGPGYRELSDELARLIEAEGRDPALIRRACSLSLSEPWPEVRENLEQRIADGVDYLVCGWPGQGAEHVEEFATRIMPDYD